MLEEPGAEGLERLLRRRRAAGSRARTPWLTAVVRQRSSQQSVGGRPRAPRPGTGGRAGTAGRSRRTARRRTSPRGRTRRRPARSGWSSRAAAAARRPLDTIAHRYSSVRLSSSCTIACGARCAAPATPGLRLSSGTPQPSRWIGRGAPQVADRVLLVVLDGDPAGVRGGHPAVAERSSSSSVSQRSRVSPTAGSPSGSCAEVVAEAPVDARAGGSTPGRPPRAGSRRRGGSRCWSARRACPR